MPNKTIAKPFSKGKYEWYKAKQDFKLTSKAGRVTQVKKGDKFGIRPATSKPGMLRVIVDELGKNIVFSMNKASATKLLGKAAKAAVVTTARSRKENERIINSYLYPIHTPECKKFLMDLIDTEGLNCLTDKALNKLTQIQIDYENSH